MSRDHQIQTINLALRSIAKRRAALDAEEARWLREAERVQLWRHLGMVSLLDYLERVLGYTPRMAIERLRVARALGELPELTTALADGRLSYSALREITRVATPSTEREWRDAAAGKNVRQIEELVSMRRPGDRPSDPAIPDLRPRVVQFEVSPETFARLRDARAAIDAERGERLDDDRFVAALCGGAFAGDGEPSGRAKFQLAAVTVCSRCEQGWQTGAGTTVAIDAAAVARARCDAQDIGSLDSAVPARATQDVTPKTRRFVWRRDGGRCVVAGCRSTRNLEIHHVVPRGDGGTHEPANLVLLCDAHHVAHHAGTLVLKPQSQLDAVVQRVQIRDALVAMGWKRGVASAAVERAIAASANTHGGTTDETLLRAALRECAAARRAVDLTPPAAA